MNIITETNKVFRAMVEIEGERWEVQEADTKNTSDTHFYGVYNQLRELIDIYGQGSKDIFHIIYGAGGWNRYPVRCNGDVCFSRYHCPNQKMIDKAIELGFEVF